MQDLAEPLVRADAVGPTPLEVLCELAGIGTWGSDLGEPNLIRRVTS